jgi:hypothetical protein
VFEYIYTIYNVEWWWWENGGEREGVMRAHVGVGEEDSVVALN